MADDFSARYRLLKCIAVDGGIRTHSAQELATGRVVMVHLADNAGPEEVEQLRAQLARLTGTEKNRVLETATIPSGFAIVTDFISGMGPFSAWVGKHSAGGAPSVEPSKPRSHSKQFAVVTPPVAETSAPTLFETPPAPPVAPSSAPPVAPSVASPPSSPLPPPAGASTGSFTQLFGAPVGSEQPPTIVSPPAEPLVPMELPSATPAAAAPTLGGFTQMFGAASAAASPSAPAAAEKPLTPATPPPAGIPPAAAPPSAPTGGFTQMFGAPSASSSNYTPPANPPAATPRTPSLPAMSAADGFTEIFQRPPAPAPENPRQSPFSPGVPPALQPAVPPSGTPVAFQQGPPPMWMPSNSPPPASPSPGASPMMSPSSLVSSPTPPASSSAPNAGSPMGGATGALSASPSPLASTPGASAISATPPMGAGQYPGMPSVLQPPVFKDADTVRLSEQGAAAFGGGAAQHVPSDFTNIIKAPMPVGPDVAPTPATSQAPAKPPKRSVPLGLIVIINVVLLATIALVFFLLRTPQPTAPALPTAPAVQVPKPPDVPKPPNEP